MIVAFNQALGAKNVTIPQKAVLVCASDIDATQVRDVFNMSYDECI